MKIDFCIPAYNEEIIIEKNTKKIFDYLSNQKFSFDWKIVLINNGSTDNTGKICSKLANEKIIFKDLDIAGKGGALKHYWEESQADIIMYMDSDIAVSLEYVPDALNPIISNECDLTMGSRMIVGSKTERSLIREIYSQGYNYISRVILGHKFSDLQCGFKAIRTSLLKKILPNIKDNQWFFDTELVLFADMAGGRIKEVPVDWEENRYEERKTKANVIKNAIVFTYLLFKLKKRLKK